MNSPKNLLEKVNPKLRNYVETNIFPEYAKNDWGHQLGHIEYVIRRSLKFASTLPNINYDIAYVVAAFHDIGHHIDAKHHERVSAQIFLADKPAFIARYLTVNNLEQELANPASVEQNQ